MMVLKDILAYEYIDNRPKKSKTGKPYKVKYGKCPHFELKCGHFPCMAACCSNLQLGLNQCFGLYPLR